MFTNNTISSNDASAVAYKQVRLVDDRYIDLYVYQSRGKGLWTNDQWLEDGRPRELSNLNLSTWSLLTTSIKEYQTGLRRHAAKTVLRMILPIYILWFGSLFIVDLESVHGSNNVGYILAYYMLLIIMVYAAIMVGAHYKQVHVDTVFNPAVAAVLEELAPKLTEAGFEVTFMVESGAWCQKPSKSFLRFTPLPDEERRAVS